MNRLANNLLAVIITLVLLACLLLTGCAMPQERPRVDTGSDQWRQVHRDRAFGSPFDPATRMMK